MKRRWRRSVKHADLDITAFMNLMVILVPFLLITAVFSRVAVLQMEQPGKAKEAVVARFDLRLTLTRDGVELAEASSGLRQSWSQSDEQVWHQVREQAWQLKQKFPQQRTATIMAADDVRYEQLVAAMDALRIKLVKREWFELFPDIAISDVAGAQKTRGRG